jgi:ribosomal protein S18 acetylase RimI-like enzyme
VRIRRAELADCAGLARVQVDSYRTAYAPFWSQEILDHLFYAEQEDDWRAWIAEKPEDLLYVAEADGVEIAGYALARAGPTAIASYDSELLALHVHPRRYRQGIGRQLVATVAVELARQGCTSLILWMMEGNPARGFYERLGGQLLKGRKTSFSGAPEEAYGWPEIERLVEAATPPAAPGGRSARYRPPRRRSS